MSPDTQRRIARAGGMAAHAKGAAHEFTPEEAVAAGRKGGVATWERKRAARNADAAAERFEGAR